MSEPKGTEKDLRQVEHSEGEVTPPIDGTGVPFGQERKGSVAGMNIVQNPLQVRAVYHSGWMRAPARRQGRKWGPGGLRRSAWQPVAYHQRHHKEKVVEDAQHFAKTHDLAEYSELFGRAALVARDKDFTHVSELEPDELEALHYERPICTTRHKAADGQDGTRPGRTAPTCPSRRRSGSTVPDAESGSWASSTQSST